MTTMCLIISARIFLYAKCIVVPPIRESGVSLLPAIPDCKLAQCKLGYYSENVRTL